MYYVLAVTNKFGLTNNTNYKTKDKAMLEYYKAVDKIYSIIFLSPIIYKVELYLKDKNSVYYCTNKTEKEELICQK